MMSDGQCPWRMAATVLWGSRDAARCHLAVPAPILPWHTPDASWKSNIQMETESVDVA